MSKILNLEEVIKLAIHSASQTHGGVDIVQIACQ